MKPPVQGHKPQSLKTDIWTQAQLSPKPVLFTQSQTWPAGWGHRLLEPSDPTLSCMCVGGRDRSRPLLLPLSDHPPWQGAGPKPGFLLQDPASPVAQRWSRQAVGSDTPGWPSHLYLGLTCVLRLLLATGALSFLTCKVQGDLSSGLWGSFHAPVR